MFNLPSRLLSCNEINLYVKLVINLRRFVPTE